MEDSAFIKGVSHVSLSVSDLHRSLEFYRDVLKLPMILPPQRSEAFNGEEALCLIGKTALALHCHDEQGGGAFDPRTVGLDHLAFHVSNLEALQEWETSLDDFSCSHSGIVELEGFGHMIEFRDPDGIQLELFTTSS